MSSRFRRTGDHLTIPVLLAIVPTVAVLFGWFLDRCLGTIPWFTVSLLLLGFVAAAREVWRQAKDSEFRE